MNEKNDQREIKIELTPEMASGKYANLAIITHSVNEFFMDFISVVPNAPQARVQSRIIMTPENAKTLLMALQDNIRKYPTSAPSSLNSLKLECRLAKHNILIFRYDGESVIHI